MMPTVERVQNESGETPCLIRWRVELPEGWLGAWDKEAFDAFVRHAVAAERADRDRVLALQQASYEREIRIEVEIERERCARLCEAHAGLRSTGAWVALTAMADRIRDA